MAFLQETHLITEDAHLVNKDWVGEVFVTDTSTHSKGVAILVHKRLSLSLQQVITDPDGHFLTLVGKYMDKIIAMINVYGPNTDSPAMSHECFSHLLEMAYDSRRCDCWWGF